MAKIIRQNLGHYCYAWRKGNRVPFLGLISYNVNMKAIIINQPNGQQVAIAEEEIAGIWRAAHEW